jgi:hypothetical protein
MVAYQKDNAYALAAREVEHTQYQAGTRWGLVCGVLIMLLMLVGCAGMSDTEQRTLSGGAIGAAGGAVVGAIAGNTGLGLAAGAAAGAAGGYLYDRHEKSKQQAYDEGYQDAQAQSR